MESSVNYKDESLDIIDEYVDIGYMAENIEVSDIYGKSVLINRATKDIDMKLLISYPSIDEKFLSEILRLDSLLSLIKVKFEAYLIFDSNFNDMMALKNRLKTLKIVLDTNEEFGELYATKIVSGTLKDRLTKSLFVISKDGAIFNIDMPKDLSSEFDFDSLQITLNRAYITYTGVGCH
jgi:peroxiredoxin